MNRTFFVTAISTDSGKTLTSAILCEALRADYWKPVQSGLPRDTDTVQQLVSNKTSIFHPERFVLKTPASPHAAAKIDGIEISLRDFHIPSTENNLIIEGAGGCLVPINDHDFVIDLIKHFQVPVILVANLYLGSINHTLLTIEALRQRNITIAGIVFNGDTNPESERIILLHSGLKTLLHIQKEHTINQEVVKKYADKIKIGLNELI